MTQAELAEWCRNHLVCPIHENCDLCMYEKGRADAIDEFVAAFEKEFAPDLDKDLITMIEFNKWFENVTKLAEQLKKGIDE